MFDVPRGSVLGPLLLLLLYKRPQSSKKIFTVHDFADDTNLLYLGNSIEKLNTLFTKYSTNIHKIFETNSSFHVK